MGNGHSPSNDEQPSPIGAIRSELERALGDQPFSSEQELQDAVAQKVAELNQSPVSDFQGLSREQMHRLLHAPFDAPDLVRFAEGIEARPAATAFRLLEVIVDAAGEEGIKLTAKGNLPRAVVFEAKEALKAEGLKREWLPGVIRNEDDFLELHLIKVTAGLARFMRKERGRLKATRATQKRFRKGEWAAIYHALLQAYCRQFNWAYADGWPDLRIVQDSFAFFLYLLHRFGDEPRPVSFYQRCFSQAFPAALRQVNEEEALFPSDSPERIVHSCWSVRTVRRFAMPFGLIEEVGGEPDVPWLRGEPESLVIRRSALYDRVVSWGVR
ncbi:hypothetical protein LRF89_11220 [Halorhodospira sp. 9621]|uniref:hypothetical protein n=1 Tax=Halorhodospira sp. 9621 TaxID=2899135 RepID=UPI001EE90E7C|nr:hypothetical protein [Halorhodospira sp. 9621]MCG5534009.1 hypothetical protein [Halorhodospira sp. 9621]